MESSDLTPRFLWKRGSQPHRLAFGARRGSAWLRCRCHSSRGAENIDS